MIFLWANNNLETDGVIKISNGLRQSASLRHFMFQTVMLAME